MFRLDESGREMLADQCFIYKIEIKEENIKKMGQNIAK